MRMDAREIHLFVGKRGTGKSNRAKALVRQLEVHHRVLAFDLHDEHSRKGLPNKETRLGCLRDRIDAEDFFDTPDLINDPDLSLAIVPRRNRKEAAEDFRELAEIVMRTGNLVLLVDEVGHFQEFCADELSEVACQSRHIGVPVIFIAQRTMQVPKTARTQCSHLNSGRQDDPEDLDCLRRIAGRPFAMKVATLQEDDFAEWHDTRQAEQPEKIEASQPN